MSRKRTFVYFVLIGTTWLMLFMNSAMPNRPSASATSSMPSSRCGHSECEAFRAGLEVGADDAEHQAEHRHRHALERRTARQRRARQQAQQHQRTDFGGTEFQRDASPGSAPGRSFR